MFGYMTDLDLIEECTSQTIEVSGHDLHSALFNFLDEWLFNFSAEPFFVPFKIEITQFSRQEENIEIKAVGFGDIFSLGTIHKLRGQYFEFLYIFDHFSPFIV